LLILEQKASAGKTLLTLGAKTPAFKTFLKKSQKLAADANHDNLFSAVKL